MAAREKYARCAVKNKDGVEFIVGLEMRPSDKWIYLRHEIRTAAQYAIGLTSRVMDERGVLIIPGDYDDYAETFDAILTEKWPDRAYFIEVGVEEEWVQIFAPWGVPRASSNSGISESATAA